MTKDAMIMDAMFTGAINQCFVSACLGYLGVVTLRPSQQLITACLFVAVRVFYRLRKDAYDRTNLSEPTG